MKGTTMTPDNALTNRNYIRSQLDQTLARRVCDPEDETLRQQMEALIRQLADSGSHLTNNKMLIRQPADSMT